MTTATDEQTIDSPAERRIRGWRTFALLAAVGMAIATAVITSAATTGDAANSYTDGSHNWPAVIGAGVGGFFAAWPILAVVHVLEALRDRP